MVRLRLSNQASITKTTAFFYLLFSAVAMVSSSGCGSSSDSTSATPVPTVTATATLSPTITPTPTLTPTPTPTPSTSPTTTVTPLPTPQQVIIPGSGNLGIFDPSLAKDPLSDRIWMSYSSVNTSNFYPSSVYWTVSIRLAYSDDQGENWIDAGVLLAPFSETLVGPLAEGNPDAEIPPNSAGIWQSETSSLVYDPGAPLTQRWKLIWHQYLHANGFSFFVDYAWLAMKMAASPLELADAPAIKLFAGAGLQADHAQTQSPAFSPLGGEAEIYLNTQVSHSSTNQNVAELNLCIFAEPALHANNSALYLALYCADAASVSETGSVTEYIVYFRCEAPCEVNDPDAWDYLGRLLTPTDAQLADAQDHFQAPALVETQNTLYLLVTAVNKEAADRYSGCRVYQLADVNSNTLLRENSVLREIARVDGVPDSHHGACDMEEGLNGGILLSQFGELGTSNAFTIIRSHISLP